MITDLINELPSIRNKKELIKLKNRLTKKHHLVKVPKDIELLCNLDKKNIERYRKLFISKPVRTMSGVAPIAVMCKPFACPPQAKCIFCPGGPGSVYGDTPKSYPGGSPAHLRGERNYYDPYLQVFNRLEQYSLLNQDFSKIEFIIMGGTFLTYPKIYREEFVKYAFKALNDFSEMFFDKNEFNIVKFKKFFELPADVKNAERTKRIHEKLLKIKNKTDLRKEQIRNEKAKIRCVTFCIETRPDCSDKFQIDEILELGATRVELGIQSIYDDVLEKIERGHGNKANIEATRILKDSFYKVGYHIMLGLPGSDRNKDINMFKELFDNSDYKPDALKIYPCLVFKGTKLYEQYKKGEFKPITTEEAAEIIVEIKKYIPEYCRVMRIQRDIPKYLIEAGVEKANLRQLVMDIMRKKNIKCRCIRCREPRNNEIDWNSVELRRLDYEASSSKEIFISVEDVKNDILLGFNRLRIPYNPYRNEITDKSAGIREIHVYGRALGVGKKSDSEIQHKGIGKTMMEEAEKIAREEYDKNKMVVIAGIGVREYFRKKFNYKQDGPYVSKRLS